MKSLLRHRVVSRVLNIETFSVAAILLFAAYLVGQHFAEPADLLMPAVFVLSFLVIAVWRAYRRARTDLESFD